MRICASSTRLRARITTVPAIPATWVSRPLRRSPISEGRLVKISRAIIGNGKDEAEHDLAQNQRLGGVDPEGDDDKRRAPS